MVAIFGTMVADVMPIVVGVPYYPSTIAFAIILAVVFTTWYKVEKTLITLSSDEDAHETFQWVDTLMSNLKAFIDGTYHGRERFKQLYTAEFTYRLNRRHMGHRLVEQLLNTCALTHPINVRQTA